MSFIFNFILKVLKFVLVSVLLVVLLGVAAIVGYKYYLQRSLPSHNILQITLEGPLSDTPSSGLSQLLKNKPRLNVRDICEAVTAAAQDPKISGLALEIRYPQLRIAQFEELDHCFKIFKESKKWSMAYFESSDSFSLQNDLSYAAATLANQILLPPSGEITLTSLKTDVAFFKSTLNKFKIIPYFDQRYEYKNYANTFTQDKFTKEHLEATSTVLNDLQTALIEKIAANRKVTATTVRSWLADTLHSSKEALKHNLIDKIGYYDSLVLQAESVVKRHDKVFIKLQDYLYNHVSTPKTPEKLALINIEGPIVSGKTPEHPLQANNMVGAETIAEALRAARKAQVKGVLVRINSPGGSYIASDLIRREIELTKNAGIPVVASLGSVAASGGYFIAIAANKIIANLTTITGSIGVVSGSFALREFFKHWFGVNFDSYKVIKEAKEISFLDPPTPAVKAMLSTVLDRIYQDFIQKVGAARDLKPEYVHKIAKGRIWSGKEAFKYKLIDGLGDYQQALGTLKELAKISKDSPTEMLTFPESKSTWQMLSELFLSNSAPDFNIALPPTGDTYLLDYQLLTTEFSNNLVSVNPLLPAALPSFYQQIALKLLPMLQAW